MLPIGTAERAALQGFIEGAMLDVCTIDAYTEDVGELNEPLVTYVSGEPMACRFRGKNANWNPTADFGLASVDAFLQLPNGTEITSRDQVTITKRFGETLAEPLVFAVVGEPTPAVLSLHVKLQEAHL
jgi:hypothetical protein